MVIRKIFVSLHYRIYSKGMDKRIEISNLSRSDKGKQHRKYRHGGVRIGMYNFNGELEAEFEDLNAAVERNGVGATYVGIVNCITGKVKKHAGKIWRKEEGGVGYEE